jgi:Fe-S oxidoreductase/FAD/FMN-containing dehydrogenase
MSKINNITREYLKKKFRDRVTFNRVERKLYGHDVAVMPGLFRQLIGNTIPEAVVQPESEDELVELLKWANENNVCLTPRGKASSGYGGAVPIKNGIVVDFYRMKKIIDIDSSNNTVTVEAGVVWDKLDKELAKQKLALRLYPTSYPSSTAAGWLAQGGAGIGSYEYGWYRDNVVSARVVMPSGDVHEFRDDELDLVADAEGITGFITQVTLRVMPAEKMEIMSLSSKNPEDLQKLVEDIINANLPIWSVMFINPRMAKLKNRAPLMEHLGHPVEERVILPEAYIMTVAYSEKGREIVKSKIREIARNYDTEILSEKIARHEWEHRFNLMVVKRLGPSLVPAEIVIPLSELADVMAEIEKKINQPLVKEGLVIRNNTNNKPEVVILGFIPSDQRKFSYNFVFGLVLTLLKIAQKHGGRPYSTGLYFTQKASQVIGKERVLRLKAFKKQFDPRDILNPGKVIGDGTVGKALSFASAFEPLIRPFGNRVNTLLGEKPGKSVRGIPADVVWYAYSCSQCGYCVDECDQFYGRGWESQSPRGKWYWLREYIEGREKWDQFMVDTFMVCTTCELCNLRCSASLPIEPSWMKLRGKLVNDDRKMTFPPFEVMAAALEAEGDIWAGYRKDRSAWFPEDLLERHGPGKKSKSVYFAGCTASYVEKDIAMASVRLLDAAGVDFTYLGNKESCCATPMLVAGKWDLFVDIMKKNISAVEQAGADTVITSCPACDMMWRQIYPAWAKKLGIDFGIITKHYSEVVSDKIKTGDFKFPENGREPIKVTWHDSCHIGRVSAVYEEPRDLIRAIPKVNFVEMPYNREEAHCCGSVLTLIKEPKVAAEVGKTRIDEAAEVGVEKILALCPCCEFQLRVSADKKNIPIEVIDLARFASSALGYDFPDPHLEVKTQWAVFEAMIALMTPQGFADLMKTMWPELIDAMPFGMGKIMRFMGKIPGALFMLKPMFPVLFPLLLPMMMPNVMSVMLRRIDERVPMPGYMAEQMPDLMPKVMNNLMPHMIKDLVPLITQPMIDYLGSRK